MEECLERTIRAEARAPVSTYRIQFHHEFDFAAAERILAYIEKLGIGDVYCSPLFEARPGSLHGYDIIRHDRFSPELGGLKGFNSFSAALEQRSMGLLLDLVPNHMGVGNQAAWWRDVLENGHSSQYAGYFDIDWRPLKTAMRDKLLLPILGDQYGIELENKKLQITVKDGWPYVQYYDHLMPLSPRSLPILFPAHEDAENAVPAGFRDLLDQLSHIPPHETSDQSLQQKRRADLLLVKPRLLNALSSPEMRAPLARSIQSINGIEGRPHSFDRLHRLLEAQPYRLALWRTSAEEINYRRFFDINDLVGLRMENPEVFRETHRLVRSLLATGRVTGLRIDHCDGMFNPRQYLIWLQLLYLAAKCRGEAPRGETAENGIERDITEALKEYDWSKSRGPFYAVVEKVLEPREYLPAAWPVSGTTGYDFAYLVNGIFIREQSESRFDALYAQILGHPAIPEEIVYRSKLKVMQTSLASEVHVLTNLLGRIASANRSVRDFTDNILDRVLRETIACFPVYRTYLDESGDYGERGVAFIRYAIARAKRLNPDVDGSAFDFLRETLLLRSPRQNGAPPAEPRPALRAQFLYFALKFQQLTGPVMAKGVEDTAFYIYNRFISSNEVGGSARSFGISLDTFDQSSQERLKRAPDSMLATSTHDTKRSEDVRSRLNVLSEIPRDWSLAVHRWRRMNARWKRELPDGRTAPDANEEYLFYQTIVGAWPWRMDRAEDYLAFLKRIQQYAKKALSEAKVNMSWINPDHEYMEATNSFLASILAPDARGRPSQFIHALERLLPRLRVHGAINSLAQLVIKIASPGVPDFYQGTELWNLRLVDPDNRNPVDYELRSRLLDELLAMECAQGAAAVCRDVLRDLSDGRIKLWVTHRGLALRKRRHALFRHGEYVPLRATGSAQEHVIAFLRRSPDGGDSSLAVTPRFSCTLAQGRPEPPLAGVWGNTRLVLPEAGSYQNIFTDETLSTEKDASFALSSLFAAFPVALLSRE